MSRVVFLVFLQLSRRVYHYLVILYTDPAKSFLRHIVIHYKISHLSRKNKHSGNDQSLFQLLETFLTCFGPHIPCVFPCKAINGPKISKHPSKKFRLYPAKPRKLQTSWTLVGLSYWTTASILLRSSEISSLDATCPSNETFPSQNSHF